VGSVTDRNRLGWFNDLYTRAEREPHIEKWGRQGVRLVAVFEDSKGSDNAIFQRGDPATMRYAMVNSSHRYKADADLEALFTRGAIRVRADSDSKCHITAYRRASYKIRDTVYEDVVRGSVSGTTQVQETCLTRAVVRRLAEGEQEVNLGKPEMTNTVEIVPKDDLTVASRGRRILAVGTEWHSAHGGISTFNRDLCITLAGLGHEVSCVVGEATDQEVESAKRNGVQLLISTVGGAGGEVESWVIPSSVKLPEVVIGHDRITGGIAVALVKRQFPSAKLVQFIHTHPEEIDRYKAANHGGTVSVRADNRQVDQDGIAGSADLVVAVGPMLHRETATRLKGLESKARIWEITPGFHASSGTRQPPQAIRVLLLGRAEHFELKGLDIAARAMALFGRDFLEHEPAFVVLGAPEEKTDELENRLRSVARSPGLQIYVHPYTPKPEFIHKEILMASVLLMPSRSEGFGLVGLEAISHGIPVLISQRSGLAEVIENRLPQLSKSIVVPVRNDLESDAMVWAGRIEHILRDRTAAFARAAELRDALTPHLSWGRSAEEFGAQLEEILKPEK
jgi:glycosyltransferase involved in cell wall biosynthesis